MKKATWPTPHLSTGNVRTMLYEEEASLAMSWWSSMTVPPIRQRKHKPCTPVSATASLASFGEPTPGDESLWLLSLCKHWFPRGMEKHNHLGALRRTKATHIFIVLSCGCHRYASLPHERPNPDIWFLPLGWHFRNWSNGICLERIDAISPCCSFHITEGGSESSWCDFCWLIILLRAIPQFWSALEGQGRLEYFGWSAYKAS